MLLNGGTGEAKTVFGEVERDNKEDDCVEGDGVGFASLVDGVADVASATRLL